MNDTKRKYLIMNECQNCNMILKLEITNRGSNLKDLKSFLICMEDILRSMIGFENMECSGKSRPRYDTLEYIVYGTASPRECRKAIQEIRALICDGYDVTLEVTLDPCSTCKCVGLEAIGKK